MPSGLFVAAIARGLLAGCGSGSASPGVANLGSSTTIVAPGASGNSGPPPSPRLAKAQLAYSACASRAHGIANFPDPQASGGLADGALNGIDQNSPQFVTADKDCAKQADAADMAPPTKAQLQAHMAMMLKITACMHAHGFSNFPDPTPQCGFSISSGQIYTETPQHSAAAKTCGAPLGGGARQRQ